MSDGQEGEKKRREPDREVMFYYNRERRLERASPSVRALNEQTLAPKGGVIRSLTSTKSHTLLFVSLLIIMAMILVFSALQGAPQGALAIGGNALRISAGRSGEEAFIVINKTVAAKEKAGGLPEPYVGEVYVAVSPILKSSGKTNPADIPVHAEKIFFTLEQEEGYRLSLPFSAENYLLLFQVGDQRSTARVKTEKNMPR